MNEKPEIAIDMKKNIRKILITGITGSGGSYLADYIFNNKKDVSLEGTSRSINPHGHKNLKNLDKSVKIYNCDLTDFSSCYRAINESRPDTIFHLASIANVRESFLNPIATVNNNVNITLNLLETLRTLKDNDGYNPLLILCSSSEVYGIVEKQNNPITEDTPLNPVNPYSASKLMQDSLGHVYSKSYSLRVIRTRMFSYLNARRRDLFSTSFAMQAFEIANGKRDKLLHGNLESERTIIDIRDAVEAYWICAEKGREGEIYNIGGTESISVGKFLEIIKSKFDQDIHSEICSSLVRPTDIPIQRPDHSKFTSHTGWKPKYSLNEAIGYFLNEVGQNYKQLT
tara:strand:- start:3221 stop:4246 length:1026 start_codon:yes stop_codon:yes gene_type:complete